ncbi:SusC/RagA family TonB-linked outer membrane protein [Prevotella sp. E9-3]|uniref:SusC/RagA family TonB-linked outer membrane protein n=1 Tax=Prevotella sp. E9-3 TaxID=2913621 RepID=UPI001EDC31F7|nr:SusC/RagA family TonB-linked outer membrane protein [Prevotella sp. E9-3]UKK48571.1 SusC/RagA family TonB-linked outer membrane protein [Prevotella sp. E9-3]
MKQYILFGLSLLLAFPLNIAAQDETEEDDDTTVRTFTVKKKQYETRVVKGTVLDATTLQPISGAIVRAAEVDGYSVLTEDDGTYEVKVPVFTNEIVVSTPDHNVVRMGLQKGEQQKNALLYPSVFATDYLAATNTRNEYQAKNFQYSNAINIKDEIQKQVGAQVHTISRNGTPGVGSVMFVQGLNSLNRNAQPLVVIDGVIVDQQYSRQLLHEGFYNDILSNLNPADIERVTVLRNGTALYGARGANGVVQIETRRNKSMATRITASLSAGVTFEPKYISMMSGDQYRGYASEMLKTTDTRLTNFRFLTENPSNYYYTPYHQDTDWKDLVYRTALTQNYGINVEGGDDVANYNLSVGYTSAESTLKNNDMDRLNIRFNTDIVLTKNLGVRFDASFSNQTRNLRNDGAPESYDEGTPTSPAFLAYVKSPFISPYTYARGRLSDDHLDVEDESYLNEALASYTKYNWRLANPAAINEYGDGDIKNRFENSMLNLTITPKYQFNPNLSLSEHFSYNLVNTSEKFYVPVNGVPDYYVNSVNAYCQNEVRSLASKQNSVMSDTRLDWHQRYDAHFIHLFGGARINWEDYSMNSQLGYNTGNDKTPFMHAGLKNASDEGINESWNMMAWYAQAEYNYLGRYFLQANLTAESSSRFGKDAGGLKMGGVSWGVFPGVQASWVVTNEPWMSGISGLDYLRLTAGYDVSGNDDIDFYASQSYFRASQFLHTVSALAFEGIGSNKIKWETTRRFNAGFESKFFNNRLGINFNYFRSTTSDLLMKQSLGFLSGIADSWVNNGKMENQGYDVTATMKVIAHKDWQWQLGASVGHYKNKITELAGVDYIDNEVYGATIRTQVGQAANLFYGYQTEGVFSTTADAVAAGKNGEALYIMSENGRDKMYFGAGDMHFTDMNGDGQISEADRVVIGDPNPDIYGNIFTTVGFKRFKLDVNFNYSLGNDVYNYMRSQLEGGSRFMNQTNAMNRRWQAEGQVTDMPRITFQDPMGNARFSDRWIEDGSYLRLKTVTLSYTLPLKSEYIQGLQFWVQGNNLLTFSKYLGSDPESSMTTAVIGQGIDLGQLAQSRSIVAGVKINL